MGTTVFPGAEAVGPWTWPFTSS